MQTYVVISTGDLSLHPSDLCPCLRRYPASGGVCQRVPLLWAVDHGYVPCPRMGARG